MTVRPFRLCVSSSLHTPTIRYTLRNTFLACNRMEESNRLISRCSSVATRSTHLHQLPGVALVEQIVDTVRVDADPPRGRTGSGHLVGDFLCVVASVQLGNCIQFVRKWCRFADCLKGRRKTKDVVSPSVHNK